MSKKSILLLAGLLFSVYSFAQLNIIHKHGNHALNDSTVIVNGPVGNILTDTFYIVNTGASTIYINAKRDSISEVAGSDNWFCWYLKCFYPGVDSSNVPVNGEPPAQIGVGDTNKSFYCDYNAGGNIGTSWIRYAFINSANRSDTAWLIVEFNATLTGVQNIAEKDINLSAPYPSPANSSVNFSYSLSKGVTSANLKIYNLLGECIQTLPVSSLKNKTTIDVQSMPSGIYVCAIAAPGCQPVYQKMIVSH